MARHGATTAALAIKARRETLDERIHYLHWSKVHHPVRYELTASGMPHAGWEEIGFPDAAQDLPLAVRGPYGDPELVELLAERYGVDAGCIVPVPGASAANFAALAAVAGPGDAIAVERPVYDPIRRIARFLRLQVHDIHRRPETNFGVDPEDVTRAVRGGARALVLTNLHNPSARELELGEIGELASACADYGATLILDEVYLDGAQLSREEAVKSGFGTGPNVFVTNSLTKVYGLSGLRMGWVLAPPRFVDRIREITNLLHVDHPAPATALAIRALKSIPSLEARFRATWQRGQGAFRDWMDRETRIQPCPNERALFRLLRLPKRLQADRFNEHLVRRFETQVVPGHYFDLPDHIRLGLTLPAAELNEALHRVSACLDEMS